MVEPAPPSSRLVEAKTVIPAVAERLLLRERLDASFAAMLQEHRVLGVWATAGAGKTTAVRQGASALGWPVAWLTLDPSDAAPGRLLAYLTAAIGRVMTIAHADGEAGARHVNHFEAAALLAQALPRDRAVVVFDELERIADAPAALDVISGFLRYLHPEIRVVLVGRREVELDAMARLGFGAVGRLGEQQLAFNQEEAAEALRLHGLEAGDPQRVVEATGGWVTGVLFEAWKSREHVGGSGGEADPLAGYLAAEILDGLDSDEREFLIRTSVFDHVTTARAEAIGEPRASQMLQCLRSQHLPVTWLDGGTVLRCHPRFREYLRSLLDQRDPALTAQIRHRYGLTLASEERPEEALEELLASGYVASALEPAEQALPAAIARLDLDLAQSWLDRFDAAGLNHAPFLLRAQLSLSIAREKFQQAVAKADALRAMDALDGTDPSGLEHRVLAAWAYWHVGRLDDMREMLAGAPPGHGSEVIGYLSSLVEADAPASIPQLAGGPLDALTLRISFARGRLADIRHAPVARWTPAASERASALRALGDLDETRRMLSQGPGALANLRFEGTVRTELMIDLGNETEARDSLMHARRRILDAGSYVLDVISRILAAKLELRLRRDAQTALAILGGIESTGPARDYGYLAEQIDMWTGWALLVLDRNADALARLRAATESMQRADRILELPTAAVYRSEAETRLGNEVAATAAAEVALHAAARQGSRHLLFQALGDAPSVAARQLDSEADPDGVWHDIGRALQARSGIRVASPTPKLRLRDLGPPALIIDGEERRARISKTYALLAYLVEVDGRASRPELLDALFGGRDDDSSRAYLRQAAGILRGLLPDGVVLLREADLFLLQGAPAVETDSMRLRVKLNSAAALLGEDRVQAASQVLDEYRGAVYLPGVECDWVLARRAQISGLLLSARVDTAIAAFAANRFAVAGALLDEVVRVDPLREQAWRLLMRVSAAQGLDDRVIDAYRRCEAALDTIGLQPSSATRLLVAGLRR
jgi:LuxR family maltose regulon positive regulatory protein